MARPRKLKSGADAHNFTPEERSRGGQRTAEKRRLERQQLFERAAEKLADQLAPAVQAYAELLAEQTDATNRRQVAKDIIERFLGRPAQTVELGSEQQGGITVKLSFDPAADDGD